MPVTALLVPAWDGAYQGSSLVEQMWGGWPPLALWWLLVVVSAMGVLAPAVALGWR